MPVGCCCKKQTKKKREKAKTQKPTKQRRRNRSTDVVGGFKSFSFPDCSLIWIVSSTTPASVSLVLGFTHDKSIPYLFSTPQTRSQQQTEIFVHLLRKLAPVIEISGVLSLVETMWIFSPRIWEELQF